MTVRVVRPGMLTTVQDLGRPGYQAIGVPEGGAMDAHAARLANLLAGNDGNDAVLECTLSGPELVFERPAVIALGGGDLDARVDGEPITLWRATSVSGGATLRMGGARMGCRAYLAVTGGVEVPTVLGSRSTYLPAGFGGFEGRALRAGDVLTPGIPRLGGAANSAASRALAPTLRPAYGGQVRLIVGGDAGRLTAGARATLFGEEFRISSRSDRMGCRLEGPTLELREAGERPSAPVTMGTVQLPPAGAPIILMADRQTTGGYPTLGQVATVDLGIVAQLRPGDSLRFAELSLDDAQRLYLERERTIRALQRALALSP